MSELFDTKAAAAYLGLSISGFKRRLYGGEPGGRKLDVGTVIGNSLVFTKDELDALRANPPARGRPVKSNR